MAVILTAILSGFGGIAVDTIAATSAAHAPSRCENCATPLQGQYCHRCGQSVHSPLRHAGHALEELIESFWHLDGRVFRTLRDLLVPGRVAAGYLAGHRVRYVAPLRLFVVLSVLAIVAAQFALHAGPGSDATKFNGVPVRTLNAIGDAPNVAEVERLRREALAGLVRKHDGIALGKVPAQAGDEREATIERIANERIAALTQAQASGIPPESTRMDMGTTLPWDPEKNPIHIAWLPDAINGWLTTMAAHAQENIPRFLENPHLFTKAYLSAVPKALFVLVPLFAMLLKLVYGGSGRLYLEHLVVALYSHAWMLVVLLAMSLLVLAGAGLAPYAPWAAVGLGWVNLVLWWSLPAYLLLMQKRVYAGSWASTLLRYLVLGFIYCLLVAFAALALLIFSFVHG